MSAIPTHQLQAFLAVADAGGVAAAARRLHLTPSAISHALKALEDDIGSPLFERAGRSVALTQAGEAFQRRAQIILREMREAREELRTLNEWGRGRLRLSASTTACQYFLPSVLREFQKSFPRCRIEIQPGDTPQALDRLLARHVDLAVAIDPGTDAALHRRALFADELVFVVGPAHPWARRQRVPPGDISRQSYILYNRTSATFRLLEQEFARNGLALPGAIELGSMEAIKELVKLNLGVSLLAPWIVRREVAEGSLVAVRSADFHVRRQWSLVHLRGRRLSLAEETFAGLCKSVSEKLGGAEGSRN